MFITYIHHGFEEEVPASQHGEESKVPQMFFNHCRWQKIKDLIRCRVGRENSSLCFLLQNIDYDYFYLPHSCHFVPAVPYLFSWQSYYIRKMSVVLTITLMSQWKLEFPSIPCKCCIGLVFGFSMYFGRTVKEI